MTAADQSAPRPVRRRTLRDELLDDLRQAAPMPAAPPTPVVAVQDVPAGPPAPAGPERPTVELHMSPRFSWGLRMKTLGEGPGVVIGAGPVQISLTGFRR
jgi:hypothetical protein